MTKSSEDVNFPDDGGAVLLLSVPNDRNSGIDVGLMDAGVPAPDGKVVVLEAGVENVRNGEADDTGFSKNLL
jgi:hypothetical protein